MRVTLVSTHTHPIALGLRYISSQLKGAGHDVQMIFMTAKRGTSKADFTEPLIEDLVEHLRERDLIGMGLMTNTFHRASVLTRRVREAGIKAPILWGGTHPTLAPEECLDVADVVCVGEGENAAAGFAGCLDAGKDPTETAGLMFRAGGPFGNQRTIRNPVGPLVRHLDAIAFPDYDLDTHWVAQRDRLVPARPESLRGALGRLRVLSTRGCPNRCTFCNNTVWREIYEGKGPWVRMRSVNNVLNEIEQMRKRFPGIEAVNIVDDLFFVRNQDQIREFAVQYARRVGLPLEFDAFPNSVTEAKIRALSALPIRLISLGIESASTDTLRRIYNRPTSIERIIRSIELFSRYRIPAEYHYLVSNPYEPDENVIETMRFIASHHRGPARLRVFPLMLYPGTPLYERARTDGVLEQLGERAYRHTLTGNLKLAGDDYLGVWLRVVLNLRNIGLRSGAAHRLIDVITHAGVRKLIDRPWFTPVAFAVYQVVRKIGRNFIYQPFVRPLRRLARRRRLDGVRPRRAAALTDGQPT